MLAAGATLGPYKILAALGAGGMGEVYRGRDTRIGREIAVKILPPEFAADPERLRRFEHEARALGALNHPNLVTLHDLGNDGGQAYLVTELLEGHTLRDVLGAGPLPLRRALDHVVQIATGLAAAHAKGIAHRDLKPENVFVTRDGRVKILDFGLARQVTTRAGPEDSTALTEPGAILGTAGYMAPEQVRGLGADTRADLFALGCVLYEMLAGKRAFAAPTAVETLNAILTVEPAPLEEVRRDLPPAVCRIVQRCLEKDPTRRVQSALDLAFQLEGLSGASASDTRQVARPRVRPWLALGAILVIAAGAVATWSALGGRRPVAPTYTRLTFRRGNISNARYSPDGRTVVYSAGWDGEPGRIYATRLESRESSPLALPEARLLAVSSTGELAIAVGPGSNLTVGPHTTLARVPLAGGAPRELLNDVVDADWSPDGTQLAVVRFTSDVTSQGTQSWVEYPIGRTLYRSTTGLVGVRVSPNGDRLALLELESGSDYSSGSIVIVDRAGHARKVTPVWEGILGMAWSPRGDEVWFTAVHIGSAKAVHAVSLSGRDRLVLNAPGALTLDDVARDGHVLLSQDDIRISTLAGAPGSDRERDLSWQETTVAADLSPDGRTLCFTEYGSAAGAPSVIGLRGTDGSPVMKLGEGYAGGLSPDGRWVVGILLRPKAHLTLLPTGAGQARDLDPGPVSDIASSCWAPDGRHIVFEASEPGHGRRVDVQDVNGGPPRAFTPEETYGGWHMVTPDGRRLLAVRAGKSWLFPLDGGPPEPVPALGPSDVAIRWTEDGRSLLVRPQFSTLPARLENLDLATGRRRPFRSLMPADPAGVLQIVQIFVTSDERAYVYSLTRQLSDLYEVQGLH